MTGLIQRLNYEYEVMTRDTVNPNFYYEDLVKSRIISFFINNEGYADFSKITAKPGEILLETLYNLFLENCDTDSTSYDYFIVLRDRYDL